MTVDIRSISIFDEDDDTDYSSDAVAIFTKLKESETFREFAGERFEFFEIYFVNFVSSIVCHKTREKTWSSLNSEAPTLREVEDLSTMLSETLDKLTAAPQSLRDYLILQGSYSKKTSPLEKIELAIVNICESLRVSEEKSHKSSENRSVMRLNGHGGFVIKNAGAPNKDDQYSLINSVRYATEVIFDKECSIRSLDEELGNPLFENGLKNRFISDEIEFIYVVSNAVDDRIARGTVKSALTQKVDKDWLDKKYFLDLL